MSFAFSDEFVPRSNEIYLQDKIYLSKNCVFIDENSIWVRVHELTIPAESLFVDECGIYITSASINLGKANEHVWAELVKKNTDWTCANCGANNSENTTRCWWCKQLKEWKLENS